ncbi:MAG: dihydrofolate reductase, partial [bacterium]
MSISALLFSCNRVQKEDQEKSDFKFLTEQFGDAKILRYQVPGFEQLSLNQKKLIYYLSQAALCGRDIIYDQNYDNNLLIRKTLEAIYSNFQGDKNSEDYRNFVVYTKRFWFSNGIHHHYSTDKFLPDFSKDYFATLVKGIKPEMLPLQEGQTVDQFLTELTPIIFDPGVAPKRVSLDPEKDLVLSSSANFYSGVNQTEVEDSYTKLKAADEKNKQDTRISYGLNDKVVKEGHKIQEVIGKLGGMH